VGRVSGHRGRYGELTVRTLGAAAGWVGIRRVWVGTAAEGRFFEVEHSRAYRDRLVLKLAGVDEGNSAAGLRGAVVTVREEEAPALGAGEHYVERLIGLRVVDESGCEIGCVEGLVATGGVDVLSVRPRPSGGGEAEESLLIPFAREFVRSVDAERGEISVRVPEGLRDLNRRRK
jgi:16S rRNA processing protein RimM